MQKQYDQSVAPLERIAYSGTGFDRVFVIALSIPLLGLIADQELQQLDCIFPVFGKLDEKLLGFIKNIAY